MDQAELELQLKVWKDLAVSKQMLIRTATDAFGLDVNCSTDELKTVLDKAIKRAIAADVDVEKAQEQAKLAISVMENKLSASERAQNAAESAKNEALTALEDAKSQMAVERSANIKSLQKVKDQLAEKQKALKTINAALADTPENVVKKLKVLKKQKTDEANARKRAETDARSLRKDKKELEKRVAELEQGMENSIKLAEKYRELHTLCDDQQKQLKPLLEDKESLANLPKLEVKLLESIEEKDKEEKE